MGGSGAWSTTRKLNQLIALLKDRVPSGPRDFAFFFILQGTQFVIVVVNGRAFNHLQYTITAVTDAMFCLLSWTIWKRMKDAEGWWAKAGYVLGGTVGSLVGMYITRMWGD